MRRALSILATAAFAAACGCNEMSDSERQRLKGEVEKAQSRATELDGDRLAAVSIAAVRLVPRKDLGECPVKFPSTLLDQVEKGEKAPMPYGIPALETALMVASVTLQDKSSSWSRLPKGVGLWRFNDVASPIVNNKDPDPGAFDRIKRAVEPAAWTPEMAVVIDKKMAPSIGGKEFEGGLAVGRAYVYSYADKAVVCMSRFLAQSSDKVTVELKGGKPTDRSSLQLEIDLALQAVAAARSKLVKAGPAEGAPAEAEEKDEVPRKALKTVGE